MKTLPLLLVLSLLANGVLIYSVVRLSDASGRSPGVSGAGKSAAARAQIQALGERAKGQVGAVLGTEASEAYLTRASWINHLRNGIAYSTDPKDAPPGLGGMTNSSVYPVMPAGARISTESRTIISGDSGAGRVSVPMTIIQSTSTPAAPPANPGAPKP